MIVLAVGSAIVKGVASLIIHRHFIAFHLEVLEVTGLQNTCLVDAHLCHIVRRLSVLMEVKLFGSTG